MVKILEKIINILQVGIVYFFLFAFSFWGITSTHAQVFKAGIAVRIITPDPLLPVSGGIGKPEPVTKKMGDLYTRALVFEKGNTRIAIVSIDNLGWPAALGDKSRALIKEIPPENILIGATHTHSAPDAYGFPDENGNSGADLKYLDWCVHQIADAVHEALATLQPVDLKINVEEAQGKIAYNYYAPKLYDPRCGVIQGISRVGKNQGKTLFTLVNYAIHPEIIGPHQGILSPDLIGPLYDRIAQRGGGIGIFMNSAQGGMVTADNRLPGGKEANDWAECKRIGSLLADEALRIINKAPVQSEPGLYCTSRVIKFPVDSDIMRFILSHSPLGLKSTRSDSVNTRMNLLNVGTAQILTIPGEALPNIGYYLKRKMHTPYPFLFGLTNDAFGYILTKEDFNSFHRYDYISRTSLGEKTGEILIREALYLIRHSPYPDPPGK
ncbi:MAG: hypothetical protein J7K46_12265 [Bacteroidales bacterium]|nr:hypothetical protein [Bacteroidales bacterium]